MIWWAMAWAQAPLSMELPAVGTSAALADGPGLVADVGVASVALPGELEGVPLVARGGLGYLGGPVDDALLLGVVLSGGTWAGDPSVFAAEGRLSAAIGSPQRTTWLGADLGVGVQALDAVRPHAQLASTLAVDLDPLTTVTVRLGSAIGTSFEPRLGLGFVYRPSPRSHVAVGADVARRAADLPDRYAATGHLTFGGRAGPEVVLPTLVASDDDERRPEDLVAVVEHPMLQCGPDNLPTGRPPPLGREAFCVRVIEETVVRDGPYVRWHDGNNLAEVGHYALGKRTSTWSTYDHDGILREAGIFEDDVEQGLWTTYFSDGNVEEKASMVDGELHGPWRLFHRNGGLAVEGQYAEGLREGVWLDFDDLGIATRERIYVDGRLQSQRELIEEEGAEEASP